MATFVTLMNFTEQGIRNVKETTKRADAFIASAKKSDVTVKEIYWTVGSHDGVIILEAPNEEAVTAVLLSLGSLGNVRTQTLRAFDKSEIEAILAKAR